MAMLIGLRKNTVILTHEIMDFADELAERFEDKFDCNVSENDDWVARIIEMFDAAGRKESNDD